MHKVQLIYQWYLVLRHIVKNTDVSFCVEFVLEATTKKSQVKQTDCVKQQKICLIFEYA